MKTAYKVCNSGVSRPDPGWLLSNKFDYNPNQAHLKLSSQCRFGRSLIIQSCQSSLQPYISSSHCSIPATILPAPSTSPSPPLIPLFFLYTVPSLGGSYSELELSLRFEPPSRTASQVYLPLSGRIEWAGKLVNQLFMVFRITRSLQAGELELNSLGKWPSTSRIGPPAVTH